MVFFHPPTNNMSSEVVLKLNVIVLLPPMFINKHSFEVVRKKVCVGGQIKLEVPGVKTAQDSVISAFTDIQFHKNSKLQTLTGALNFNTVYKDNDNY